MQGEAGGTGTGRTPDDGKAPGIEVLIPTFGREAELAVTLAGLAAQTAPGFAVVVSDQSDRPCEDEPTVRAMIRVLRMHGHPVRIEQNLPRRGMAQQRNFLLGCTAAQRVLFLDNDVWLEPGTLQRLDEALTWGRCGFMGAAVQGLSFLEDVRPREQEPLELWDGPPQPERVRPGSPEFGRWTLHNAANLVHVARELEIPAGGWEAYKVAWIGGCVLFDRSKLVASGGFDFWEDLPPEHAGEDMVAQMRVMEAFGGAGIVPSGAVHLEAATTVTDRSTEAADVVLAAGDRPAGSPADG